MNGNGDDNGSPSGDGEALVPNGVQHLRRLIEVARGRRRPLVHLQHNPDPDALGSGAAVRYLLKRLLNLDAILAYTGRVGRVENRAMLRYLKIEIMPSFKIDYDQYDLVIVVDTHPGSGTCRLPMGVVPDVVVDHHPAQPDALQGVAFPYFDPAFGSTSTMIGALFVANGITAPPEIATALTYGIRTDTMDLARGGTEEDEAIYRDMYAVADKQVLARIERARVPQQYFIVLERGLRNAQVTDNAVTTYLGEIAHSDAVAEVADLLFRLEGMKWVMVAGHTGPIMYCSLRATQGKDVRAGEVARTISEGKGGGHDSFAAAQVPMDPGTEPDEFYADLRQRFLKEIGAKQTLTKPLTLPPEEPGGGAREGLSAQGGVRRKKARARNRQTGPAGRQGPGATPGRGAPDTPRA